MTDEEWRAWGLQGYALGFCHGAVVVMVILLITNQVHWGSL